MKITLLIKSAPFSINKMYFNRKGFIRTIEYRRWCNHVFNELNNVTNSTQLDKLRVYFDENSMSLISTMTAYYPKEILITKKENISHRGIDTTNWEKPLQDLIFDKKYYDRRPPEGCKNLKLDDKYVLDCHSKRRISNTGEAFIIVTYETIITKDILCLE